MFSWKKIGRIFNPQDIAGREWLHEFAQAPSVLVYDEFVRIYFSCRPRPDAKGYYTSYTAFADFDKSHNFKLLQVATRPVLELGSVGTFDEFGTYPLSVIRDD